ncbi:MAG: hypothetical protein AAB368_12460 [bacterium]
MSLTLRGVRRRYGLDLAQARSILREARHRDVSARVVLATRDRMRAGMKRYWRSVQAAAARHDLPLPRARSVIREARRRDMPVRAVVARREARRAEAKAYWRDVKATAGRQGLPVGEARRVLRAERSRVAAAPPPAGAAWVPERPEGEFVYSLVDVDRSVPARFVGVVGSVVGTVTFTVFDAAHRIVREGTKTFTFLSGASDHEFWSNFYAAFREQVADDVQGTARYEAASFEVIGLQAA